MPFISRSGIWSPHSSWDSLLHGCLYLPHSQTQYLLESFILLLPKAKYISFFFLNEVWLTYNVVLASSVCVCHLALQVCSQVIQLYRFLLRFFSIIVESFPLYPFLEDINRGLDCLGQSFKICLEINNQESFLVWATWKLKLNDWESFWFQNNEIGWVDGRRIKY